MISRYYIVCATCRQPHIARIQVGAGGRQEHTFPCSQCKQPIKVALDVDNKNVSLKFHLLENCVASQEQEGTPVYLSPNFVADAEHMHDEHYFGSFDFLKSVMGTEAGRQMMERSQGKVGFPVLEEWKAIEKIWRLEDAGQYRLSSPLNTAYADRHGLSQRTLRENLWGFINSLFPMHDGLRQQLKKAIETNRPEFQRFLHYYQTELRPHHRRSQLNVLNDYFSAYQEHSQVFPYLRIGAALPRSAKATSINFSTVKSFYATAFEFLAEELCVLTCLNNIIEGRSFDQLQRISLKKYLETDKAERRNSLSRNPVFASFAKEFDSTIRNASYHNWFFLRTDNATIEFKSGGTGALNEITYTDYLYRCGMMVLQVCNLFSLELELDQIACDTALVTR